MAKLEIVITHGETDADITSLLGVASGSRDELARRLIHYLSQLSLGVRKAQVKVQRAAAQATGTITAATVVATNTVTINNVTFTAVASGATGNQFNLGASDAAAMDNLATVINANTDLDGIVTAASDGAGVVTLTAIDPGEGGNAITLASSGATLAVSAARLASGSNGTEVTYTFGGYA